MKYFFIPADASGSRDKYESTAVSYEQIEGLLDDIPARQRLVLMDTCCSGHVDEDDSAIPDADLKRFTAPAIQSSIKVPRRPRGIRGRQTSSNSNARRTVQALLQETFVDLRRGPGAAVISAAGGVEAAVESDQWKNGALTYAIIEGLTTMEADTNGNHLVTASELEAYVERRVSALTEGMQLPTTRRENFEIDFPVYQVK